MTDTTLEILTLGRFSISMNGNPVAVEWPDETVKVFFCSLLSPLDLYFSWDRLCRSLWNEPETRTCRHRLEELVIRPLNSFLIKELGFNPLSAGAEGIRINRQGVHIDAHEFHNAVIDGLGLLTLGSDTAALEKLSRADTLYSGNFLPGMPGKIIGNARRDLEALYRIAVLDCTWHSRHSTYSSTSLHAPEPIRRVA